MGLDLGPASVEQFAITLRTARRSCGTGPWACSRRRPSPPAPCGIARAVVGGSAFSVIGGGDTIAAVNQAGVADRIGYISTAGGAFLEFPEGRTPPGVEALTEA
jgi:phosphoglycerate kinase